MNNKIIHRNMELENILKMKQKILKKYAARELKKLGYEPIIEDGYVFALGSYPVLLVAHMDTVHKTAVKKIQYDGSTISSPQGIGGDDRCGVYIILQLLKKFNCSVLFTEDEEIGCKGAKEFVKTFDYGSLSVNYIIEFDRRGSNDCVFYQCDNPEFEAFIESTGYFKTSYGSYSDICEIAPAIGIAAVNLSSAYYNEHTQKESINLSELNDIITQAEKVLSIQVEEPFIYIEQAYAFDDYYESNILYSEELEATNCFHVYLETIYGIQFCCEVFAINKMEALGIVLSRYPYYSAGDVVDIFEEDLDNPLIV